MSEKLESRQGFTYPSRVFSPAGLRRLIPLGRYLLIGVAALAVALAARSVVLFVVEPEDPVIARTAPPPPNPAEAARKRRVDPGIILRRNLFGTEPDEPEAETVATFADEDLELALRGTAGRAGSGVQTQGFAIIEDVAGSRQDVFAVGDFIFDGPRLVSVEATRAIIEIKGKHHVLELIDPYAKEPEAGAASGASKSTDKSGIRRTDGNSFLVDRREIDHSIENLNYVITQARAVPVLRAGESIGFRLFNIRKNSVFERMGLVNGDIVQRVNGVEVRDASKAVGLLDEVQSVSNIKLDFLRGGKPQTFSYTIR